VGHSVLESPEHLGVELLRDVANPSRYLTIDRWKTSEAFGAFRKAHAAEYEALDVRCEGLTEAEVKIGVCSVI
jgi:heme-degrading monooxygenase HmoA